MQVISKSQGLLVSRAAFPLSARLGPPNVTLWPKPETGSLNVRIRDPFHKNDFSHDLKYRLYYRREDGDWMVRFLCSCVCGVLIWQEMYALIFLSCFNEGKIFVLQLLTMAWSYFPLPAPQVYRDTISSLSIDKLEVGLNYCVKVEYLWRSRLRPNSVPSAPKCAIISESGKRGTAVLLGLSGLWGYIMCSMRTFSHLCHLCIYLYMLFLRHFYYFHNILYLSLSLLICLCFSPFLSYSFSLSLLYLFSNLFLHPFRWSASHLGFLRL